MLQHEMADAVREELSPFSYVFLYFLFGPFGQSFFLKNVVEWSCW
jgi:hypothetical protein